MDYPKHSTDLYKGIEIEISYQQDTINPFEDWDGCVPLISLGSYNRTDYSKGNIIDYLRNYLTYNQVKRNQTKILEMIEYGAEEFRADYPLDEYDRTEMIKDDLLYDWLNDSLRNMETFCIKFNIKHYKSTSRGYGQSDWADVFMCWTPEFEKMTGRDYTSMDEKDFEDGFNLFTNWAWGDVYQYYIEETGDSCGGFYGDDFENNGLLEYAKNSIDCHLEDRKRNKKSKLKTLIKNDVPFQNREQILEAI
jgi:intein/homing endonuclease